MSDTQMGSIADAADTDTGKARRFLNNLNKSRFVQWMSRRGEWVTVTLFAGALVAAIVADEPVAAGITAAIAVAVALVRTYQRRAALAAAGLGQDQDGEGPPSRRRYAAAGVLLAVAVALVAWGVTTPMHNAGRALAGTTGASTCDFQLVNNGATHVVYPEKIESKFEWVTPLTPAAPPAFTVKGCGTFQVTNPGQNGKVAFKKVG